MRRKIIAGNWKMHMLRQPGTALASEISRVASANPEVDVVLCPPYTLLGAVGDAIGDSLASLGAQDAFWRDAGAYTGQVSPVMLIDAGVTYVIVGHSECRGRFGVPEPDFDETVLRHFGDSDRTVNLKLLACLSAGLRVICCVGETLGEREAGQTDATVQAQIEAAIVGAEDLSAVVVAYEPVWAIGTGRTCDTQEADRVCGVIRSHIRRLRGADAADRLRIQYGGSVKRSNARELLSMPNIDGALVGGASLVAQEFAGIIEACR